MVLTVVQCALLELCLSSQLIAYVTSFNESVVANDFNEYGCLSLLSFPDWCGDGCFSHDSTCSVFCNLHAIQSGTQISSGMRCPICFNSLVSTCATSFGDMHGSLNHVSVFRRYDNVSISCTMGNVNYNSGVV